MLRAASWESESFRNLVEFSLVHLFRGHSELVVASFAIAARVAVDDEIVRRIREHDSRATLLHERSETRLVASVAAENAVATERPEIPKLSR